MTADAVLYEDGLNVTGKIGSRRALRHDHLDYEAYPEKCSNRSRHGPSPLRSVQNLALTVILLRAGRVARQRNVGVLVPRMHGSEFSGSRFLLEHGGGVELAIQ